MNRSTKTINRYCRIINIITVLLFFLMISSPTIRFLTAPFDSISVVEKRKLAVMPKLSFDLKTLEQFPEKFNHFFNDHFGFRDQMMRWQHYIKIVFFHTSPEKKWLIGKKCWEFITLNKMIDDFRGLDQYSLSELAVIRKTIQARQNLLAKLGIKYLVVVAPNKQTIYPEYLPNSVSKVRPQTKLDQLVNYLRGSQLNFFDLRGALLQAKEKELLYLPKNSHWNQKGAFVAYQAIMTKIKEFYPKVPIVKDNRISIENKRSNRPGIYNTVGLFDEIVPFLSIKAKKAKPDSRYRPFIELFKNRYRENYKIPVAYHNLAGQYKIAVFRDSFFTDMMPYFSESFNQSIYIYEPYNEQILAQLILDAFKPDIIIEELVERNLWRAKSKTPKVHTHLQE